MAKTELKANEKKATHAHLRGVRTSAQKCRLVADQVRGMQVGRALELLKFSQKKAANFVKKAVESAIANAEHNHGLDIDELKIRTIYVNEGSMLKRFMPRAKGRASPIKKQSCHITVVVSEQPGVSK